MIKFRYKRKEPTNNGSSGSSLVKNNNNKSVEIKAKDGIDDNKQNSLKCETSDSKSTPQQMIKTKTSTEQEYMEDCIRAIVVSAIK